MAAFAAYQANSHERVDSLVSEPRCRVERAQVFDPLGLASSLFQQLSPGAVDRLFARVETTGWYLVQEFVSCIPILLQQHDLWIIPSRIGQERHDGRCSRM